MVANFLTLKLNHIQGNHVEALRTPGNRTLKYDAHRANYRQCMHQPRQALNKISADINSEAHTTLRRTNHAQTCANHRQSTESHSHHHANHAHTCANHKKATRYSPLTNHHSPTTTHPLTHYTLTHTPVAHPLITHSITHQTPKTKICKSSCKRYLNSFVQIKFKNNSILIIFF